MATPKNAGNPVRLVSPFHRIVNVGWRTSVKGIANWDMGEFGATTHFALQELFPVVGDEVPGPQDIFGWVVNSKKVATFALKQLTTPPAQLQFIQLVAQYSDDHPEITVAPVVPSAPSGLGYGLTNLNFSGVGVFLNFTDETRKYWFNYKINSLTSATMIRQGDVASAASWADYLAAAGLPDPGVVPGGTDSIVVLITV